MCGRYSLSSPGELVADLCGLETVPELSPRYNIAPTQEAPAVRALAAGGGDRRLGLLRWGLIPYWARDPSIGNRLINARVESAAEKPSFGESLERRRCLVIADGFFEWQKLGNRKQPFHFRLAGGGPLAFAGLWDRWRPAGGEPIESFTILTTDAAPPVAEVHDRMPVFLPPTAFGRWLDPGRAAADALATRAAAAAAELTGRPVDPWVNDPAHDDPRCIEPLSPERRAAAKNRAAQQKLFG